MKDTNNIETYNIWSGTDYNKNTNDFTTGTNAIITSTNNIAINGENSLAAKRTNVNSCNIDTTHLTNVTVGKIITYKCKIYTPDMDVALRIRGANATIVNTVAPASDNIQEIMLSCIIPDNYSYMCMRMLPQADDETFFVDDINCIII